MPGKPDSIPGFAEDEIPQERGPAEEGFLAESEDEANTVTPEVELLNDVTQHYLNEIGARPLFYQKKNLTGRVARMVESLLQDKR